MSANRVILTSKQKALKINLDPDIYGTFAEIGAGQETVRHFFRSGGASGTIAKAMSAYDKDFSDAIYGREMKSRYVCESRLRKMISHEYNLIIERLSRAKHPNKRFFTFANTVTTINYSKTVQGHGWFGMRFQRSPDEEPSDVILHVRMHDGDASTQQEKLGELGVNLLYGCFHHHNNHRELLLSLYDSLSREHVEIDMVNFEGPAFKDVDNRLVSLQLVKNGMTEAVIFGPDGKNLQASEALYKRNIMAIRGSFRPVTNVNIDMIMNGYGKYIADAKVDKEKLLVLFEITLSNLKQEGEIDEKDFLDRADILCSLGQTVMISNYQEYYKLVDYFSQYTKRRIGMIMGANNLLDIFNEKYYRDLNGGILQAFGIIFTRDLKIYLYPAYKNDNEEELITSKNAPIHPRLKPLYDYLLFNKRIIDLEDYDEKVLKINSREVLDKIRNGEDGWEEMVPGYVDNIIKENELFGYKPKAIKKAEPAEKN
jgi:hypothetical protein